MKKRYNKRRKNRITFLMLIILIITLFCIAMYKKEELKLKEIQKYQQLLQNNIQKNYSEKVITTKSQSLYIFENNKYQEAGKINKDIELTLEKKT